ncbi:hypothetical protein DXG01_009608 [Tephrocybe rancida]|nr:hypothetical protein DXG01_009608 [Tephrocybe rancida]
MVSNIAAAASHQNVTLPDIPELYDPSFLDVLLPASKVRKGAPAKPVAEAPKNMMMDALKGTHHTLTENNAPAYSSTLSPTLDAFQNLSSATSIQQFNKYLENSWAEDPELTLRIIWNIRSIHDGKGDKELFYKAFGWLFEHHPRTAIRNLPYIVKPVCSTPKNKLGMAHGYWKDLLNILTLATVDELYIIGRPATFLHHCRESYQYKPRQYQKGANGDPKARQAKSLADDAKNKKAAREKRAILADERHAILVEKLAMPNFRALYIAVARLFAERLAMDLRVLSEIEALSPDAKRTHLLKQISLAGKWAPTPCGAHDKHTNIATAIALLLRHSHSMQYPSILKSPLDPQETAVVLRSFFQRWILRPLRSISEVPEPLMSANRWAEIKYNRVGSVCMKNNMERFFVHDRTGFQSYLASVESGRKKISGATLLPHELVIESMRLGKPLEVGGEHEFKSIKEFKQSLSATQVRVVEAQWKTLINRIRESGSLDNSLAICDVSGSMGSVSFFPRKKSDDVEPIFPAISLSLVLASLAKPPFNGGFITFSAHPQFVELDLTQPLHDTVQLMGSSGWGMNTDLNAVFLKLLLPLAVKNKVPQEDMIKRLFIFSDMQFDDCSEARTDAANWKTNHDVIEEAYKAAGYEMPQIVYWDLANHGTVEVEGDREGVALMNGFSPAMMKVFMGETDAEE